MTPENSPLPEKPISGRGLSGGRPSARRIGTIWTYGPDMPLVEVVPHVRARFARVHSPDALAPAGSPALAEFRRRLESGRYCYAAWVGQTLAAYGWISFKEEYVGELDLRLALLPGEAYLWDCYTFSPFRGKSLYAALLAHMVAELRSSGCERDWIGADVSNQPSQKGIDRAGFARIADLGVIPGQTGFVVLPYHGVPEDLVRAAARVYLNQQ